MFGRKQRARIAELEGKVAVLATTLRWYADPANWQRRATHQKGEPLKWEKSPAAFDRGARASSALVATQPLRNLTVESRPSDLTIEGRPSDLESLIDRFIRNAHGEPPELAAAEPAVVPPAIDPLSVRMES